MSGCLRALYFNSLASSLARRASALVFAAPALLVLSAPAPLGAQIPAARLKSARPTAPAPSSANSAAPIAISFTNDVVPVLTRFGCNQGACHGAQYGKGGFKLSLAGFDADLDYVNIVKATRGRRINVADPTRSLLLLKPTMAVAHGGGRRLEPNAPAYNILRDWLRQGVPAPNPADPHVVKLLVTPVERILRPGDPALQLVVRAVYSDRSTRDVTARTRLNSLNEGIAACTPEGQVRAVGKGQTAIMARYDGQAAIATIIAPYQKPLAPLPDPTISAAASTSSASAALKSDATPDISRRLDRLVIGKQRQLGLAASPVCDDRAFARRVYFDLIGTPPAPQELTAFLTDRANGKRLKLIDALLARPEYADYWTLKWGDLLRSSRNTLDGSAKSMWSFSNWIHDQMRANRPIDQFTRDLILAQGSTFTSGPSNYYRVARSPQDLAETTSQVFLGVRMQCAKCHHHPFEKWSQTDYYQFAAFFARVGLKESKEFGLFGNEQIVRINDGGEVNHPKTGAVMRPTPLGVQLAALPTAQADPDGEGDRRQALADWLVAKNNRLFARNIANRYWGYLLGKGVVNPIDDQRVTNPPTNPALLDALADELVRGGYDLKHLLRVICATQTYQRSSQATPLNRKDDLFFTHYTPRRLGAESLLDAIDFACGTREKYQDLPSGYHAIQLPDPAVNSEFLDIFGRPQRQIACECERTAEPNLSQTLRLMNGEMINRKVGQDGGRIVRLIAAKRSDAAIVNDLYLATIGRPPQPRERNQILGALAFASERKPVFEDVLLTLLNSKEFLFNH